MIKKNEIDVLYVHPRGTPNYYNIPMGLIGLMNSIDCRKIGKTCFELTEEIIAKSRIIVMDCHWVHCLEEVGRLAQEFKKINPGVVIIVGGYTATIFSEMIVDQLKIDYVIKGDTEKPFPLLIKALLEGKNICNIPNLVSRSFVTPQSYTLTKDDYSRCNCINIDWFPTFKHRMKLVHQSFPFIYNEDLGIYPFIPVFKGCIRDCDFCYAGKTWSLALCKRSLISRTPESVIRDLLTCSKQKDINQVHIVADFIDVLGEKFADIIFSHRYDLNIHYEFEFSNYVSIEMLEKMLASFKKCEFTFIFSDYYHEKSFMKRYNYLAETFNYLKKYRNRLNLILYILKGNKTFDALYARLIEIYKGLMLFDHQEWMADFPYPGKEYRLNTKKYFKSYFRTINEVRPIPKDALKYESSKFFFEFASEYHKRNDNNKANKYYKKTWGLIRGMGLSVSAWQKLNAESTFLLKRLVDPRGLKKGRLRKLV